MVGAVLTGECLRGSLCNRQSGRPPWKRPAEKTSCTHFDAFAASQGVLLREYLWVGGAF